MLQNRDFSLGAKEVPIDAKLNRIADCTEPFAGGTSLHLEDMQDDNQPHVEKHSGSPFMLQQNLTCLFRPRERICQE